MMTWIRTLSIIWIGMMLSSAPVWADLSWEGTDLLSGARHSHTATLLPNGKVLVAGGWSTNSLSSCELFDPETGQWSSVGSLESSRFAHTAALLANGKVIVVGGHDQDDRTSLKDVELYDPTAGTWEQLRDLRSARERHTATLLPSGKLLVVGGKDFVNGEFYDSVEIYDPVSNSWAYAHSMSTRRQKHTATLLPSGEVLVTGGENEVGVLASAELYDPATNLWTSVGSMTSPRFRHTATLLASGQVLVVAGGVTNGSSVGVQSTTELFDPISATWTPTQGMDTARYRHSATLLPGGQVLVVGGEGGGVPNNGEPITMAEIYDPSLGTWLSAGNLAIGRFRHTATLLPKGQVLVIGGRGRDLTFTSLSQCELYSPSSGSWAGTNRLTLARERHSATMLTSGSVLFAGGCTPVVNEAGQVVCTYPTSTETYDSEGGTFQFAGTLNFGSEEHTATLLLSGKVLLAGGYNGSSLVRAEIYDPETGIWEVTGSLSTARQRHTATLLPSGEVLVAGGYNGSYLSSSEIYDPLTGLWRAVGNLNDRRHRHQANLLLSGKVLVSGGRIAEMTLGSSELFDPRTEAWEYAGALESPRHSHTGTLLPSGMVLVAGGENGGSLASSELYDPAGDTWRVTGNLHLPLQYHRASLLRSGKVLVTGGRSNANTSSETEIYDPILGAWSVAGNLVETRAWHSSTLLRNGKVLVAGGSNRTSAELFSEPTWEDAVSPAITSVAPVLRYDSIFYASGRFRANSGAGGGNFQSSSSNYPLFLLSSADGRTQHWLVPDGRENLWDEPSTFTFDSLPSSLEPGRYLLTALVNSRSSRPFPVEVECSLEITQQPVNQRAPLGGIATFSVQGKGARRYQWRKDGLEIPGAIATTYSTPPLTAAEAGTVYDVELDSLCTKATSDGATVILDDSVRPVVRVVSPQGGEFWPFSTAGDPQERLIAWEVTDNIRVCRVEVALLYSTDGGVKWLEAPPGGGLPATYGPGGACAFPGVETNSHTYELPPTPPSGEVGSLYKIRVKGTDQAGGVTENTSPQPFFIVQPNPDSVKTLILHNLERMRAVQGISESEQSTIATALEDFAHHPRVLGRLVDLGLPGLEPYYAAWDADPADSSRANAVVLALQEYLSSELLPVFTGVESIVVVGDDRIVPMARIQDSTQLPESVYTSAGSGRLTTSTTVGQALDQNFYLTDDLLAVGGTLSLPLHSRDLLRGSFLPLLAVGRLVENPAEIVHTLATFLSQDGVLDLGSATEPAKQKILVTGYDFLEDSARRVSQLWEQALGSPINHQLISPDWGVATVDERRGLLLDHLAGPIEPYRVLSLHGHATHFEEGVPAESLLNIQGLSAAEIYGPHSCGGHPGVDLSGALVYSVGCHSGLPVAGSCISDSDHSLDLPQTLMEAGAGAYIANSGFGWGLRYGVGLSERLMEVFTQEIVASGSTSVQLGKAFVRSKRRYFLEQPGFDVYDQKTLLQWAFYGLPMYTLRAARAAGSSGTSGDKPGVERLGEPQWGEIGVESRVIEPASAPDFLISVGHVFTINAQGLYRKYDAEGDLIASTISGCPDSENGCYYSLLGQAERATGTPDLPIEPYLVFDSKIAGTSQHGVVWLGGEYREEAGWTPIFAELVTNGGDFSNHGTSPQHFYRRPRPGEIAAGEEGSQCLSDDLEANSVVLVTGEVLSSSSGENGPLFDRHRLYSDVKIESIYYNDEGLGGNCDRSGPSIEPVGEDFHTLSGARVSWAVQAIDDAGVWRVLVVYDEGPDENGVGSWKPVELTQDADGVWRGDVLPQSLANFFYMIQGVDSHGNVSWVDFVPQVLPASGLMPDLPRVMNIEAPDFEADLDVRIVGSQNPVVVGSVLAYTLLVENHGPDSANLLHLEDVLPFSSTFLAAEGVGWTCQNSESSVGCELRELASGSVSTLVVVVRAAQQVGTMVNVASIAAIEADPILSNNHAEVTTQLIGGADLSVTLQADQAQAVPGRRSVYSLQVFNWGPQEVAQASIATVFSEQLVDLRWTCLGGEGSPVSLSGNGNINAFVHLAAFSSVVCQVDALVLPGAVGSIESSAAVASQEGIGDPQANNNTATIVEPVFAALFLFGDGFESGDLSAWN